VSLSKQGTEFNVLLIDSVDEAISEVLGDQVNSAFWRHFQAFIGLTRDEMPNHLDKLFLAHRGAFGVGGETLGRVIIKKLYAKANIPLELKPDRTLTEYATALKQILAQDPVNVSSAEK
jgi:hypothetical protein